MPTEGHLFVFVEVVMWVDYMEHDQVTDEEIRKAFGEMDRSHREAFIRCLLRRMKK